MGITRICHRPQTNKRHCKKETQNTDKKTKQINQVTLLPRLAPVLKTIFHQYVISHTCSQSNSDGSVLISITARKRHKTQTRKQSKSNQLTLLPRLAPVLKTIFHQCVISYTCSQSNSDGSVLIFINVSYHILVASLILMALFYNRAIRVRLATSIWYDTLTKSCFKDWSQSNSSN